MIGAKYVARLRQIYLRCYSRGAYLDVLEKAFVVFLHLLFFFAVWRFIEYNNTVQWIGSHKGPQ